MPAKIILLIVVYGVLAALFAFQLWSVLTTGHVRWRVQKVHRDHRPVAFAAEVAACAIGLMLFGGLFITLVMHH
jgi:hypothetical protein